MKLLITVPTRNELPAMYMKYWNRWLHWMYDFEDETGHKVRILPETTPNRMDVSISKCIQLAKDLRPAWWIRLDMDISPESSLADDFRSAVKLWDEHRAVTASPTIDRSGVFQFEPKDKDWKPVSSSHPFACNWISGSLVFTPQDVFDALKPVYIYKQKVGSKWEGQNMYIATQRPDTTEDYDFCERVHEAGYEVWADPAILVRQRREDFGIPSFRPPMTLHGNLEMPVQGVGVP